MDSLSIICNKKSHISDEYARFRDESHGAWQWPGVCAGAGGYLDFMNLAERGEYARVMRWSSLS